MLMIPYGSLVVLQTPKGKRHIKRLEAGNDWHTSDGILKMADIANANFGDVVLTTLGYPVRVLEATLYDRIMGIKRQTQIIYPKDIAMLCMRLGVGPGKMVMEAGCGSGGMTLALSWFCGPDGKVISHDIRPEFVKLARRNLEWAGVGQNVELHCHDIANGFMGTNADALFLDMREPWLYLDHVVRAVKPGAPVAFLLPTAPQLSNLLLELEKTPFGEIEIEELFVRKWKPLPDRLRPADRMTAHTSFLVFCRQQPPCPEFEELRFKGTRERKQDAAKQARQSGEELMASRSHN